MMNFGFDKEYLVLDAKLTIHIQCPHCGKKQAVTMSVKQFIDGIEKLKNGVTIQNAFPLLSCDDREILMSGLCDKCWDEQFDELLAGSITNLS